MTAEITVTDSEKPSILSTTSSRKTPTTNITMINIRDILNILNILNTADALHAYLTAILGLPTIKNGTMIYIDPDDETFYITVEKNVACVHPYMDKFGILEIAIATNNDIDYKPNVIDMTQKIITIITASNPQPQFQS